MHVLVIYNEYYNPLLQQINTGKIFFSRVFITIQRGSVFMSSSKICYVDVYNNNAVIQVITSYREWEIQFTRGKKTLHTCCC